MLTAVWAFGSNAMLAARRGNRQGQSLLQWGAFTGMIACYAAISIIYFQGAFREAPWILLSLTGVAGPTEPALAWRRVFTSGLIWPISLVLEAAKALHVVTRAARFRRRAEVQ
jgi:hypothetical protein